MVKYLIFIFGLFLILIYSIYPRTTDRFFETKVNLTLIDENQEVFFASTKATTVEALLLEEGIVFTKEDAIFPVPETSLASGMIIRLEHQKKVTLAVDQKKETFVTYAKTIEQALSEKKISLSEYDLIEPPLSEGLVEDNQIQIVRVTLSEEKKETAIPFKTETKEDENLSWRKKEIQQKGEKGTLVTTFRVARHDGEEVKRTMLSKEVTKEPITEIEVQGTLVKTGKSHSGGASWYAYTGTLSAANPWLPLGSYVKVTNTANGKSVIVKINDRGPFGGGRIIDLDKVAFQEIASLGQGVINVKMEEITN